MQLKSRYRWCGNLSWACWGKYYAEFVKNRIETKNPKIQIYGERYDLKITYDRESSSAGGYVYIDRDLWWFGFST